MLAGARAVRARALSRTWIGFHLLRCLPLLTLCTVHMGTVLLSGLSWRSADVKMSSCPVVSLDNRIDPYGTWTNRTWHRARELRAQYCTCVPSRSSSSHPTLQHLGRDDPEPWTLNPGPGTPVSSSLFRLLLTAATGRLHGLILGSPLVCIRSIISSRPAGLCTVSALQESGKVFATYPKYLKYLKIVGRPGGLLSTGPNVLRTKPS